MDPEEEVLAEEVFFEELAEVFFELLVDVFFELPAEVLPEVFFVDADDVL